MITGKERLFKTLRHETTDEIPWIPFAGVHAGNLKGYTATDVLIDADKLFESLIAVNEAYDPDGQPILFDLQVEAEILGCELLWAEKAPPSVASHPLANLTEIPDRLPEKTDGRLPMILDVMKRMKDTVGEETALLGLVCGPFTLASHLRGTEVFMDMMMQPDVLTDLLAYTTNVVKTMSDYYIEADMDVIAVVDPLISQIGPNHFEQFMHKPFNDVFEHIREKGRFSSFFVCGDATKNIEPMCKTNPDSICVDENVNLKIAKEITDRYNITIGGNIPLTTVMLMGSQQDNMKIALELTDTMGAGNYILAPGCDMPYDTPPENTVGIVEALRSPEIARKMLENYTAEDIFDIEVEIPNYSELSHALVEVFTLDSDTCAACAYMWGAVKRAKDDLNTDVEIIEYKATSPENIARLKKIGVKQLPSIYVNGDLKFSSLIPNNEELLNTIKEVITE